MERIEKLVKVVSGNRGSKRITIPKEICDKLGLKGEDYVVVKYDGGKKLLVVPVEITIRR